MTQPQAALLIDQAMSEFGGRNAARMRADLTEMAGAGDFYKAMRLIGAKSARTMTSAPLDPCPCEMRAAAAG